MSPPAAPELLVRIDGPNVQPNAEEIELETGEKLMIEIQSDRAGELHVHSTPEQYVEFEAGFRAGDLDVHQFELVRGR